MSHTSPTTITSPETITRNHRATDPCGNATKLAQTFTVGDGIAPEIAKGLAPVSVQCTDEVPPPTPGAIGANNYCGGVTIVHVSDVSEGNTWPETITRTYRGYDACSNTTDVTQTTTVEDDTPSEHLGRWSS